MAGKERKEAKKGRVVGQSSLAKKGRVVGQEMANTRLLRFLVPVLVAVCGLAGHQDMFSCRSNKCPVTELVSAGLARVFALEYVLGLCHTRFSRSTVLFSISTVP